MPNPLDPLWQSYATASDSLDVVRRALGFQGAARASTFQGLKFAGLADPDVFDRLDAAQRDVDDQTVLFLYATFESTLRDHVAAQSALLAAATAPTAQFGVDLQGWFEGLCRDARMDGMVRLFASPVTPTLPSAVGSIRSYRHWLAHGRRGPMPPVATPQFAYNSLTQFLQACGLV